MRAHLRLLVPSLAGALWFPLGAEDVGVVGVSGSTREAGTLVITDHLGGGFPQASQASTRLGSTLAALTGWSAPVVSVPAVSSLAAGATISHQVVATDPDGDVVSFRVVNPPAVGTLSLQTAGSYTYEAPADAGGPVTWRVEADDGQGNRTQATVSLLIQANQSVVRAFLPGRTAPFTLSANSPVAVAVIGGRAPLTWSTTNGVAGPVGSLNGLDVDGDGQVDRGVIGRLEPRSSGSGRLTVTDATGVSTDIDFSVVVEAPIPAQPAPPLPTSPRTATLFGALGTQTPQGTASLLAALRGRSATEAVAYAWDAPTQSFVQLPTQPTGGLTAGTGVFVASRVDLPVDFAGQPAAVPTSWVLQPGWNFVAIPLLVDDQDVPVASLDPSVDFTLSEPVGTELTGEERVAVFSGNWWSFDGQNYSAATTLLPGRAYWIRNRSAEPSRPLVLTASLGAGPRLARGTEHARPPLPPTSASAAEGAGSAGGCGAGGGVALLLGGFAWLARRRRR